MKNNSLIRWMESRGYPLFEINISNSFLAARKVNNLVFVSSATPLNSEGKEIIGKVGSEINLKQAKEAACLCLAHSLSLLKSVIDEPLEIAIKSVVEMTFFINGEPDFEEHSIVADAASNLLIEYFGENGKHSRSAIGAGSTVRNCSIILKATYELKDN